MSHWTKENETRLQINQNFGAIRYLFGTPFLLVGFYFLYQYLIMGIIAFIQAGDWWGLFSNVFGWLIILLIALLFLVPGWVIVFLRHRVIIDTKLGQLIQTQDFRIYQRVKQYRLDDFESIQARQVKPRRSQTTRKPLYAVELTKKDGETVVVATDEFDLAKKLRATIAAMLGLKKSRKTAEQRLEEEVEEGYRTIGRQITTVEFDTSDE
jgi:hypothetical protein